MRVLLIQNESAGKGKHRRARLVEAVENAGYKVEWCERKADDWRGRAASEFDLAVAAGGDGTVADVLRHAGVIPVAILPLGSSNNIATSLGISGTPERLAASWRDGTVRPIDGLHVRLGEEERLLVEGAGVGPLARSIMEAKAARPESREWSTTEKLERVGRHFAEAPPFHGRIVADGRELVSGSLRWMVAVNFSRIGPAVELVPDADPSDGLIDLVWRDAAENEQRERISEARVSWHDAPAHQDDQIHTASDGELEMWIEVVPAAFRVVLPA